MAHSLNLQVIAEGVETVDQARFLVDCECDLVQGFLYSKPLKSEFVEQGKFNDVRELGIAAC
jgi:EAL domain-containing protein (putative c-di-GMP-specific phosphodiesterase class I)